jgi:hypothetical protein
VVIIAVILAIVFGAGVAVVWRTRYFDSTLPAAIKDLLGLEKSPPSSEISTETPSETPSEDPTKDWKTYTNEELGFSFKYPGDWKFADLGDGWLMFGPRAGESDPDRIRPQLEFGGFSGDYGYNIGFAPEDEAWTIEEKTVVIGGKTAIRSEHTNKQEGKILIVRIKFPEVPELIIEFYPLAGNLDILDLILSNFEFAGT